MHELTRAEYERVRALFHPSRYHLTSSAVLDGHRPARVFVDERALPLVGFMLSPGPAILWVTQPTRLSPGLSRSNIRRRALADEVGVLFLVIYPERWRERLPDVLAPHAPVEMKRRHYVYRTLHDDWRSLLPDGYDVERVDRRLLEHPGLKVPGHVTHWVESNWRSTDRFLRHGFGLATVSASEVVSWSISDCVNDGGCEIGIHTVPAHRRRGLATVTAAAAVEHAFSHGFRMVGWHCPEDNLGSIGTAERVGFPREHDYSAHRAFLEH